MDDGISVEDVDSDIATAFGLYALSDATLPQAAKEVGVTRWELEDAIDRAGLTEAFGLDEETNVSETIDELLDE